ncbi:unnamed protein product [marine sediment metagenome]|uniref:Uncharacterized protein n=1 Tax=marine sediment metagenome TaxID=412755 RepID=X1PWU2_9ZZZZ
MKAVCLGKDAVLAQTETAFLDGVPDLDEDDNFIAGFIHPNGAAAPTTDLIRDNFTDALWADPAEPAIAAHILINVATREWKAGTALVDGDSIWAVFIPKGDRVLVS